MRVSIPGKVAAAALFVCTAAGVFAGSPVLYSASRTYAFPLACDPSDMAWTQFHWTGGNAVDILPAPDLRPGSPGYTAFDRSPVVAVVAGTVRRADNELGGIALLLYGDDGREYYYAHLSSTNVTGSRRVNAGEPLGVIGRTGRRSRFIEIHLHFAIASRWHRGLDWKNDVNAAQWFQESFGLHWINQTPIPYAPAFPRGSPLSPPYRIVESFSEMRSIDPDLASIRLEAVPPRSTDTLKAVPVHSTLLGEVRVMRGTVLGLRVQITNRHTDQTVVYSGLSSTGLETGDVITTGQIVGETDHPIDYMYFDKGVLTDPTPTLHHRSVGSDAATMLN